MAAPTGRDAGAAPPGPGEVGRGRRVLGGPGSPPPLVPPLVPPPAPPPGIVRGAAAGTASHNAASTRSPSPSPSRSPSPTTSPPAAALRRPHRATPSGAPGGALAGTIRGPVATDLVRRRFRGPKILGAALLLAIIGAFVLLAQSGRRAAVPWFDATELYAITILIALLALGRRRGTVLGDMAYSGRAFLPRRRRRAQIMVGATPTRPGPGQAVEYSAETRDFRVEDFTGVLHACLLIGGESGGKLADGAFVHVSGRRSRAGKLRVRSVVVLSSANGVPIARITPDRRTEYAVARRTNQIALGLTTVLIASFAVAAALFR